MTYLTLDLIKRHLNLNADFTDDDVYLQHLGDVVEIVVERHIDDSFELLADAHGGTLPSPLVHACLLILGTYYSNRENIAFASNVEVGNTYTYLTDLYRNYSGCTIDEVEQMINEIRERLDALEDYVEFDSGRKIEGEGLDVTVSGQTTDIQIDTIDEGDF